METTQRDPYFTGYCFANGDVEFDSCRANCYRDIFEFYFPCGSMDAKYCKHMCIKADCEAKCPKSSEEEGICANDGEIYSNECVMKCRNKDLENVYTCKCPLDAEKCGNSCRHRFMESNYGHSHGPQMSMMEQKITGCSVYPCSGTDRFYRSRAPLSVGGSRHR